MIHVDDAYRSLKAQRNVADRFITLLWIPTSETRFVRYEIPFASHLRV